MGDVNVKLTMTWGINASREKEEIKKLLEEETLIACKRYGAYEVRKAARQQIKRENEEENNALSKVGLGEQKYSFNQLLDISSWSYIHMTDQEKFHEFCQDQGINFWWPLGTDND
jgi:hypothetical protein